MKEDEVEYESSDSEPMKPKTIIKSSEINTHEIGNEYVFLKYDYAKDEINYKPINLVLQKYDHKTNFYFFKHPYGTTMLMRGIDRFVDKTIIWEYTEKDTNGWENTDYYICPEITYDYLNDNYCNFFIENLYYDFTVTRKEGITSSVKNARLLFDNKTLHDDSVVYIFMDEDRNKFYSFIINERDEFEFYGKKSDAEIAVRNGICDSSSKIQDICMDDLDDDDELSEETESNEIAICISCGESFFKEEEEKVVLKEPFSEVSSPPLVNEEYKKYWSDRVQRFYYVNQKSGKSVWEIPKPKPKEDFGFNRPPTNEQTLCFYCRNTIAEMDISGIVYNPMEYPGYYDITNIGRINLNERNEPQPLIITMFFGLHGHGGIVNSKDKKDIKFETRGSEFAKPFTSGYQVELSTFKSKPSCRTHMVCIGNPLFFSMANPIHNGINFNKEIDNLFQEKGANVNSVVQGIIKYETDYHNFSEKELKNIYLTPADIYNYGRRTTSLAYKNHLQLKDRTWGIATNFGLTRTIIAEKYITGYSSETEKQNDITHNTIMDPAVDVKIPIVRALYCNISYQPTGVNSNKKIDEVITLINNTTLSSISTICEDYLINFYKKNIMPNVNNQKVELVSIIIDKSCNYSTADVVFPHIPVSPRITGMLFDGKYNAYNARYNAYNAKGKRNESKSTHKTHKRKQSTSKRKQSKQTKQKRKQSKQTKQKRKQSKQKQSKQSKR